MSAQQNYEIDLVPLASTHTALLFPDSKTQKLYDAFLNHNELCDESELLEAEAKTSLNSHFSQAKYKSFRKDIDSNLAVRCVTLRQNSNSVEFNRNRTYSIVKTTRQEKDPLTASQFQKVPKDTGKPIEILYTYAGSQLSQGGASQVVQSRYEIKGKQSSSKSSRNDLRSLLSTRHYTNPAEHTLKIPFNTRDKAKSYKFAKMEKKESNHQQQRLNCNLFSFLDGIANKQDKSLKECSSAKMEPIAKPIKLKPWK